MRRRWGRVVEKNKKKKLRSPTNQKTKESPKIKPKFQNTKYRKLLNHGHTVWDKKNESYWEHLGNFIGTFWNLIKNTLRTSWEHSQEQTKNKNFQHFKDLVKSIFNFFLKINWFWKYWKSLFFTWIKLSQMFFKENWFF